MAKKKKPAKKKPLPPHLRVIAASIAKTLGDTRRTTRVSERAASHAKGAMPKPREVLPADDPRGQLVVCVYRGYNPPLADLPIDIIAWGAFLVKYGVRAGTAAGIRHVVCAGNCVTLERDPDDFTVYAVLESGRATDDCRRALLIGSKSVGVLN